MRYQRIGVAVSAGILVLAAGGRANADNCSNRTIRGAYGAQFTGFNTGKSFAEIGFFTADGEEMSLGMISSIWTGIRSTETSQGPTS